MAYDNILYEVSGRVVTITLNRPEEGTRQIHGILHTRELSTANAVQVVPEIGVAMPVPPKAARKPWQ